MSSMFVTANSERPRASPSNQLDPEDHRQAMLGNNTQPSSWISGQHLPVEELLMRLREKVRGVDYADYTIYADPLVTAW